MNRPIKFRVWCEQSHQIFAVENMIFAGDSIWVSVHLENPSRNGSLLLSDGVELMQFTGLKDCTGKEIHEGDIVQLFNRSLFQVVWDEYYVRFQLEIVQGNEYTKVHDSGMLQFSTLAGNIYEHPELLKKESE